MFRNMKTWLKWMVVCCLLGLFLLHMYTVTIPNVMQSWSLNDVEPSEKWIVIGTSSLSGDVTNIPEDTEWNVAVVHNNDNKKQSINIRCRTCYHLYDDVMQRLNFQTSHKTSPGHRNRKFIGYLFAIKHGAKYILDVEHMPYYSDSFIYSDLVTGIRYNSSVLFNQCSHFGDPTLWPKGLMANFKKGNMTLRYYLGQWKSPSVQQQVYYLITFDKTAPPVFLGAGTLALVNTQSNTMYLRVAFWALFRGLSLSPVSHILRGLWMQRLLWEGGDTFGFLSPNETFIQDDNNNKLLSSVQNSQIQKMINFIQQWKCPDSLPFYKCVTKLAEDTIQFGVFSKDDISMLNAWLNDLATLGITEVKRCKDRKFCESANRSKQTPVQFWPNVNTQSVKTQITAKKHVEGIKSICPNITSSSNTTKLFHVFSDILLVVVFNYPHYYNNIRYLEIIYRAHFPNILYCGDKVENFLKFQSVFNQHISFVQANVTRGGIAYRCLLRAMEINYNVVGYLYIGDDTLVNTWTLKNLDFGKIWLKFPQLFKVSTNNYWMTSPVGYHAWQKALGELEAKNKAQHTQIMNQWKQNIKTNDSYYHQFTDIAYIPLSHAKRFLYLAEFFSQNQTHVELTVPNLVAGMDSFDNCVNLLGRYLSIPERKNFEKHFKKGDNFLHAVKVGPVLAKTNGKKFFCETYLPLDLKH